MTKEAQGKAAITAFVTGIPTFVRVPPLRPSQNRLEWLVQQWPVPWENLIGALERERLLPTPEARAMLKERPRQLTSLSAQALAQVERWANERMPTQGRTAKGLVELRGPGYLGPETAASLVQILYARETSPSGDRSAEESMESLGVEVISIEAGARRDLNLGAFLNFIQGDLVWIVPGGSQILGVLTAMGLERVAEWFLARAEFAGYFDGAYSFVYRVSTLREIASSPAFLPSDVALILQQMKQRGYSVAVDHEPDARLCEFEEVYVETQSRPGAPAKRPQRGWFHRRR